jgi:hypothetical protein
MPISNAFAPPTCERCGEHGDVQENLTTPFAQYWRCAKCGDAWATERKPGDSSAFDQFPPNPLRTVKKFLQHRKTIVGAVLGSLALLYAVRRRSRRGRPDMEDRGDANAVVPPAVDG